MALFEEHIEGIAGRCYVIPRKASFLSHLVVFTFIDVSVVSEAIFGLRSRITCLK